MNRSTPGWLTIPTRTSELRPPASSEAGSYVVPGKKKNIGERFPGGTICRFRRLLGVVVSLTDKPQTLGGATGRGARRFRVCCKRIRRLLVLLFATPWRNAGCGFDSAQRQLANRLAELRKHDVWSSWARIELLIVESFGGRHNDFIAGRCSFGRKADDDTPKKGNSWGI